MADLETMARDLLDDTDEVAGNIDRIKRKIGQAIRHHRGKSYHFLLRRFELQLEDNGASYDIAETQPPVRSIVGETAWVLIDGNRNDRQRVTRRPFRVLEDMLSGTSPAANYPSYFSLHATELLVYPPPSGGKHVLTGWGKALDEAPLAEWDADSSTWLMPDEDFSNVWFEDGYELIREYAAWLLFSGPKSDKERARAAKERYVMIERDILLEGEELQLMQMAEPNI